METTKEAKPKLYNLENKITMEKQKRISELKNLIKMMREDEEIFGLVREDREKISKWINEIVRLQNQWK